MFLTPHKALLGAIAFLAASSALFAQAPISVTADSAVIMDAQSGKVLWSKDPNTPRYPASTTKIMTAMLLIEHCTPDEIITAPPGVDKIEGASMHLVPGETLSARDLLYGILLRSANDGCVAAAVHISGSVPAFVELMNQRAKQIGCTECHFDNPNGLNDDNHTISAFNLALIAREAMKYEEFRNVVCIRRHEIQRSIDQHDRIMVSKNKYLSIDPTADGIKTGWTREAEQCYVGSATRNGYRVITAILHGTDWKKDNATMMNWAFQNNDRRLVVKAGDPIAEVKVNGGTDPLVVATVGEDLYQAYEKERPVNPVIKFQLNTQLIAPISRGQQVGYLLLTDADGWSERVPLIAGRSDQRAASAMGAGYLGFLFLTGIGGSGAYILKRRLKRFSHAKTLRRRRI